MDETKPETPAETPEPKKLSYDKFMNIELRVAKIVEAARVEGTDKLMQLQLDVGELGPRQIVAGIAQAYEAEQLVGRRIIIVANLKPARIRGVESNGMLLAGDLDGRPIVATFDEDVPPGTRVR
jgi:methionyl-tRNA synthetase